MADAEEDSLAEASESGREGDEDDDVGDTVIGSRIQEYHVNYPFCMSIAHVQDLLILLKKMRSYSYCIFHASESMPKNQMPHGSRLQGGGCSCMRGHACATTMPLQNAQMLLQPSNYTLSAMAWNLNTLQTCEEPFSHISNGNE